MWNSTQNFSCSKRRRRFKVDRDFYCSWKSAYNWKWNPTSSSRLSVSDFWTSWAYSWASFGTLCAVSRRLGSYTTHMWLQIVPLRFVSVHFHALLRRLLCHRHPQVVLILTLTHTVDLNSLCHNIPTAVVPCCSTTIALESLVHCERHHQVSPRLANTLYIGKHDFAQPLGEAIYS